MKHWLFHPMRSWKSFKYQVEQWLTPSDAEIRMIHDRLHAVEVKEWYRPGMSSHDSLLHDVSSDHEHSWRCVSCKENVAREVVLVCAECVQAIQSSEVCYELPLPRYHHQEVGT